MSLFGAFRTFCCDQCGSNRPLSAGLEAGPKFGLSQDLPFGRHGSNHGSFVLIGRFKRELDVRYDLNLVAMVSGLEKIDRQFIGPYPVDYFHTISF